MDLIPTVFSTGWASGVNSYATLLFLGLLGRAGVGEVPEELTKGSVIAFAAVMFAIEFVADKTPYLDNTWDLVHTAIRPAIASIIGVEFADADRVSQAETILAGGGSGVTALASHGVKASLRLGVNASPEPFSNIVISLGEDGVVAVVVALALQFPFLAASIAVVLLASGIALVAIFWSRIKRAWAGYRAYRARRAGRPPPDE